MSDTPDVHDIIRQWLKDHAYDGLYSPAGECACVIGDLVPCESDPSRCLPGVRRETPDDPEGWDYRIEPRRAER